MSTKFKFISENGSEYPDCELSVTRYPNKNMCVSIVNDKLGTIKDITTYVDFKLSDDMLAVADDYIAGWLLNSSLIRREPVGVLTGSDIKVYEISEIAKRYLIQL